jgi:UDP-N-acetylmuramyl pentapeptide phosphotransferase/UDP-N-acetylglucosamine-1-phosphate transferase
MSGRRFAARLALAGFGALTARGALVGLRRAPHTDAWDRTNFRGRTVSLAGGPALVAAATASAAAGAGSAPLAAAALVAGSGAGVVGWYDDIVGVRPDHQAKGFRGHLNALRDRRMTSGLLKIVGVGVAGVGAAALVEAGSSERRGGLRSAVNIALGGGVIAGTANLVNLLDLRPGRALKAGTVAAAAMLPGPAGTIVAGPVGAAFAVLPDDLGEEVMLGDAGANAYGALIGLAVVTRSGPWRRAAVLAALATVTAASEKVSFTKVIAATPVLREFDELGRRAHDATDIGRPGATASDGATRDGATPDGLASDAAASEAAGLDAAGRDVTAPDARRDAVGPDVEQPASG